MRLGDAVVEVKDFGTGLDPAVMHRIFDRFFTTKAGGTGSGLPICQSIIDAHGGHLLASAAVPYGTAFRIHYSVAAESKTGSRATVGEIAQPGPPNGGR